MGTLSLFHEPALSGRHESYTGIPGLTAQFGFLDSQEQRETMAAVDALSWRNDLKRRVQHYSYRYDYKLRSLDHSMRIGELPDFARTVADRLLDAGLVSEQPDQMIVNEYLPGQGISAHVDCEPCFKDGITTISLGSVYEMDFIHVESGEVRSVMLELGSAIVMTGESRYKWKHQIKPRKSDHGNLRGRRISLTFRKVILE